MEGSCTFSFRTVFFYLVATSSIDISLLMMRYVNKTHTTEKKTSKKPPMWVQNYFVSYTCIATIAGVLYCFWIMKILIIVVLCCARFNYCIGFVFIV